LRREDLDQIGPRPAGKRHQNPSDNVAVFYTQDPKEQTYKIAKIAVLLRDAKRQVV
jgi:hypothetical protein